MSGQLALTRTTAITNTSTSKVNSKSVPAFLNKLYNMVDDPSTDSLIRWSENGDSFLVLDHEHFAREVLGRWFKHQNFASFVRQLNMYGFHKIPHLQQGVLRKDSEAEVVNFKNSHFIRGQPDLLCLIHRKKQPPNAAGDLGLFLEDSQQDSSTSGQTPRLTNSTGAVLDIKSMINGIAAIKRHQAAISTELKTLQQSNQHLWQEAIAARERHKKNEDTINRILRFLAGVFGTSAAGQNPKSSGPDNPSTVVPMKRARLLIENGNTKNNEFLPSWGSNNSDEDVDLPINLNEIGDEGRFTVVEPRHHDLNPEDILPNSDRISADPSNTSTAEKSQNAYPETPRDKRPSSVKNTTSTINKQPDIEPQFDPSLSDTVFQYINSTSPSEMQRLLNMFNTSSHPDLWPQSGLSFTNGSNSDKQGSALTRSPSRLDKPSPNDNDFGLQPSDSWSSIPDTSAGGELTSFGNDSNYQNMLNTTEDLQSRIDSVDFDINNLIQQNLLDFEDMNWDFTDTLNAPVSESTLNDLSSGLTVPANISNTDSDPQRLVEIRQQDGPPDIQTSNEANPNLFEDVHFPSKEDVGFVAELSPSVASSPSTTGEALPNVGSPDHKRKASKIMHPPVKSQQAKKRRTSK